MEPDKDGTSFQLCERDIGGGCPGRRVGTLLRVEAERPCFGGCVVLSARLVVLPPRKLDRNLTGDVESIDFGRSVFAVRLHARRILV
jgi:hypothetical protein